MVRLFFAFSLVVLASCSAKYKINGESSISSLDGKMLFLKIMRSGEMTKIDSAEVVHGLFTMNGKLDSVEMVMLFMDDESIMPLVLESGQINIRIDNAKLKVEGTPLNNVLYNFFDEKNALDRRVGELERKEAKMILNGEDLEHIQRRMDREGDLLSREMGKLIENFIATNYENVLGPGVFLMLCAPYPIMTPQIEDIVKRAPVSFRNNHLIKDYIVRAEETMRIMKEHRVDDR